MDVICNPGSRVYHPVERTWHATSHIFPFCGSLPIPIHAREAVPLDEAIAEGRTCCKHCLRGMEYQRTLRITQRITAEIELDEALANLKARQADLRKSEELLKAVSGG